jgi:Transposase DNA-binding/Transposase Tn5 dimerisation domain
MLSFRLANLQAPDWADQFFTTAPLGDVRRSQRAAQLAAAMAARPGLSIPALFDTAYDVKAAYTLLDRPEATPDALQQPHRRAVTERMATPGETFLILEDTSEPTWSGNLPVAGLGPIGRGSEGLQGFLLHSGLAVAWPRMAAGQTRRPPVEVVGLADQIYHVRKPRPAGETRAMRYARLGRERESQLWETVGRRLGAAPDGVRWERVCDRGADIYEFIVQCMALRHGFVIRAAQDRAVAGGGGHLFETVRSAPTLGRFELGLRARPGQRARVAHLAVAATRVDLRAPGMRTPEQKQRLPESIAVNVVRIFEPAPPADVKAPLEWILLTDAPVDSFEAGLEVAVKYSARWLIEEFHKALKTGLGAERLQLEKAERLFAAIAIMSLVALRLIDLREAVRLEPEAPAERCALTPLELAVLRAKLKRPIKTVREVALAIGRLGGHMNRKGDGLPGWQTLWVGMKKLHDLVQGVLLAQSIPKFGE